MSEPYNVDLHPPMRPVTILVAAMSPRYLRAGWPFLPIWRAQWFTGSKSYATYGDQLHRSARWRQLCAANEVCDICNINGRLP